MPSRHAHFAGPDQTPGALRDLLAERIDAVPSGGAIDWVTYYFRDRRLADDLARARERGVRVRVTLDGRPRTPHANDHVIEQLRETLADGLRVVKIASDRWSWSKIFRPRLHEKLYCFSGPEPTAFIGSFNPSGDHPEAAPDVIREIGDQDRGHNLLVALRDPKLVGPLVEHARLLHRSPHTALDRFRPAANRVLTSEGLSIHFLPRWRADPVRRVLERCGAGTRVRIAASHLSGTGPVRILRALAERGARVEILAEATARRVPPEVEAQLRDAGIAIQRMIHAEGLPMHAKFALVEGREERCVMFGSFNWTQRSRHLNREIVAISTDPKLIDAFSERWETIQHTMSGRDTVADRSASQVSARS